MCGDDRPDRTGDPDRCWIGAKGEDLPEACNNGKERYGVDYNSNLLL